MDINIPLLAGKGSYIHRFHSPQWCFEEKLLCFDVKSVYRLHLQLDSDLKDVKVAPFGLSSNGPITEQTVKPKPHPLYKTIVYQVLMA